VPADIHAAGRHFVEQGLPQMRARLFDERDIRQPMPAKPVAEARDEFEPAGAAANDDDAMERVARSGLSRWRSRYRICHRWSPRSASTRNRIMVRMTGRSRRS